MNIPSFLAILRRPSKVELKVFCRVSSTAQASTEGVELCVGPESVLRDALLGAVEVVAKQYCALLLTQKTSRQQAVTPRSAFLVRLEVLKEDVRRGERFAD